MKKQGIDLSWNTLGIKAMGAMALGLFASLLVGTIINTAGSQLGIPHLNRIGAFAVQATGPAMAVAIGFAMSAPPFVLYSLVAVGAAANSLGGAGGPLAVLVITVAAVIAGKCVSKLTPIDLIVTPAVTIIIGITAAFFLAPPIGQFAAWLGRIIYSATNLQPLVMGIIVSFSVGMILTLPISSAALCAALGLVGLAGGAALAGCCAHMVGFAVASFRENKIGGLLAQGLGTSMLQMPNVFRKPVLWLPAVSASVVNGAIATVLFDFRQNGPPISSGMGTSGLTGQIGVWTGWITPSETALKLGELPVSPAAFHWIGLIMVCFIIPAVVAFAVSEIMRKKGLIILGDLKIDC